MNEDLKKIYQIRFSGLEEYRNAVWKILVKDFFAKWIEKDSVVLDLGCGYGEFINNVECCQTHAMDLNPDTRKTLNGDVLFHEQDCSQPWPFDPDSLDLIFTSNFFEHLSSKEVLDETVAHAKMALKPGGRIIALGPNISVLKGRYWDFWDHHVALSEQSLEELLCLHKFKIEKKIKKFLPFNMVRVNRKPLFLVSIYLKCRWFWPIWGKQFLIIAKKV